MNTKSKVCSSQVNKFKVPGNVLRVSRVRPVVSEKRYHFSKIRISTWTREMHKIYR